MAFIYVLCFILAALIAMSFANPVEFAFILNSEEKDMHLSAYWSYPLLKTSVKMINSRPQLSFFILGRHIFTRSLKPKKGKSSRMILKSVKTKDTLIRAYYALNNPFYTGIAYGAFPFFQLFLNNATIEQYPDFLSSKEYVLIEAETKFNLGAAIVEFIKLNLKSLRREQTHGTI